MTSTSSRRSSSAWAPIRLAARRRIRSRCCRARVAKIDPKTKEVTNYPIPKEWQSASTQASMVSPNRADVDGKVWTNNQESHASYRIDVATGQYENLGEAKDATGKQVSGYGMP